MRVLGRSDLVCGQLLQDQPQPAVVLRRHTESIGELLDRHRRAGRCPAQFTQRARDVGGSGRPRQRMEFVLKPSAIEPLPQDLAFAACMTGASSSGDGRWCESRTPRAARSERQLPLIFVQGAVAPFARGARSAGKPSPAPRRRQLPASSKTWISAFISVALNSFSRA